MHTTVKKNAIIYTVLLSYLKEKIRYILIQSKLFYLSQIQGLGVTFLKVKIKQIYRQLSFSFSTSFPEH